MSGKVTDQAIEEIRARVDIVEFIGARMTLKKAGATYTGCCPFHREKTPSFHVYPTRQNYHCFGCGEHGDVFKFVMKQDGLTFPEAVRLLAERVGVELRQDADYNAQNRNLLYAIHAELAAFYQRCLKQTAEAEPARAYLAARKLPEDVVARFGIGYAPERPGDALVRWGAKHGFGAEQLIAAGLLSPPNNPDKPDDCYDRFRGRLMFPIQDRQGRVVAFSGRLLKDRKNTGKYVNSPETEIFTKSRVLYALDKAAAKIVKHPRREAIICEGQIDVIRCHACGFETAVASQGTAFTKEHVGLLKRHADSVVLVFDGDSAGRKAALRTGALFLEEGIPVRVAALPKGEDPDSLLRDQGPKPFQELLDGAASITAFQVETLRQAETQPDSIDAINRVARGVLDILAGCASAVQRAHLLEEAARLLHLPLSALEDDLQKHIEARNRTAAYIASARDREPATDVQETGSRHTARDTRPSDDAAATDEATPAVAPPSRTEYLLCEFLVEHERDEEVLRLVSRLLPLDILRHPFSRALVDAVLRQWRDGGDCLAALARDIKPDWRPLMDPLIANQQKMLSAREATPLEAAQDLIRRVWVQRFTDARGSLDAASTPENDAKRHTLTLLIKNVATLPWEKACRLMSADYTAAFMPAACPGAQAGEVREPAEVEPYGHGADSASGAAGPEEPPPSEYPLDEMID